MSKRKKAPRRTPPSTATQADDADAPDDAQGSGGDAQAGDAEPEGAAPRSKLWAGIVMTLVLGWIVVQMALPVSPFLVEQHVARTDFSWDMFAVRRDCERCYLTLSTNGSQAQRIPWGTWYRSPYHVARTRNRERLPKLARAFCRENEGKGHELDVRVVCECRYNKSEKLYNLDPFGGNYCSPEAAALFDD
ncbi:MAG: hypothetical protein CMH57_05990 [Myxococcales bacterium]|nr:hypothetical protein [Myxococcales bacterium]